MEEKMFAFWLCNLPGIGIRKIQRLLACFGTPSEVFFSKAEYMEQVENLREKDKKEILEKRDLDKLKKTYEQSMKKGISFVYQEEESYPARLRSFEDMPYGIFYKGNLPSEDLPTVAVVGAREASYEGREIARRFAYELAENGIQIISGMAKGIDIAAQKGTMEAAYGRTYGILGTGVDICYPRDHIESYMRMQENGGVISEFPLHTPAFPYHFPMRNRIISGFADGILVIEARKGSGSLITAELGVEQGKDIFVVPGNIMNPRYEGGNELLQNGACVVTKAKDILDGLGLFFDYDVVERKKKCEDMLETGEKIVYASLSLEPVHISKIAEKTELELTVVMEVLFSLQMKHLIQAVGNNYFAIKL